MKILFCNWIGLHTDTGLLNWTKGHICSCWCQNTKASNSPHLHKWTKLLRASRHQVEWWRGTIMYICCGTLVWFIAETYEQKPNHWPQIRANKGDHVRRTEDTQEVRCEKLWSIARLAGTWISNTILWYYSFLARTLSLIRDSALHFLLRQCE